MANVPSVQAATIRIGPIEPASLSTVCVRMQTTRPAGVRAALLAMPSLPQATVKSLRGSRIVDPGMGLHAYNAPRGSICRTISACRFRRCAILLTKRQEPA
jgi:hypothetical protein